MKKPILSMASLLLVGLLFFSGCTIGKSGGEKTGEAPSAAENTGVEKGTKTYNMVFIVKSGQINFFQNMLDAAETTANLLPNVTIKLAAPETPFNVEEQLQIIEQAIVDGADAVLCTAADSTAMAEGVKKCNEAGVLFVAPNTKVSGDGEVLTWTGIENYDVGYQLGIALCEKLGGKGNVVGFENVPGNQTTEDRLDGFMAAFEEYPDIVVLDSQPADHNREKGMKVMENFLQKYPEINGTFATSKDMTLGALEAAKASNRAEDMIHVTFDIDNDILTAIQDGEVYATGDQNERSQAANAVMSAYLALEGYQVPKEQFLPMTLVTQDNIESYITA